MTSARINRIAAFLMVGVILFVIVKRYIFDEDKLSSNYRFTEAIVYKISYPVEGGPIADFQYCVNQVIYKNYASFDPDHQKVETGDKFLLKYYPANPKIARILLNERLDSLVIRKTQIDSCIER